MSKKMNSLTLARAVLGAALSAACLHAVAGPVAVVVSAKSGATTLTKDQASDIFLGKANTLPGGGQAVPIDQAEGTAVRDDFYRGATGKSTAQMKAYWSKIIFTGKGKPPKEVADSGSVKKLLAENPNSIGYIDKAAVDGSVKVLLTIE